MRCVHNPPKLAWEEYALDYIWSRMKGCESYDFFFLPSRRFMRHLYSAGYT